MAPRAAKSGGLKTGVTPLKHPPQNALCCPATCAVHLLLDADFGVMAWGGSHVIRRNSGEQQMTERLPRRWLPRTASERSGHPESSPNARLRRARCAAATAAAARSAGRGSIPRPVANGHQAPEVSNRTAGTRHRAPKVRSRFGTAAFRDSRKDVLQRSRTTAPASSRSAPR